jgi:hypothetical protein
VAYAMADDETLETMKAEALEVIRRHEEKRDRI